ncbi:MAG: sigma-70 family RNA polymerase sigma factor [Victivallales bacterium]|jgi:RNA polymerase sigma-70 factor (ECF subfamily)|nr:sigma-70 family RNA polymerase sigma factor [Victivallales bacterium]
MPTDLELVQQFQREHDQAAFDQLVERHSDRAFQLAYSILQNRQDAEEVVQDAFIRIYRSLGNFRGDAQFSTWMYRIVVNLCNNKFRWNKVRGANCTISIDAPLPNAEGDEDLRLELPSSDASPNEQAEFADLRERLEKAMATLPESYRTAVMLRNVQQLDYEEIAKILDCAVGTVKSRINRGRELLRQALKVN